MKIALAQTNPVIGAFAHNADTILREIERARQAGCEIVVFPELALCGYPPQDLLVLPSFFSAHNQALVSIANQVKGITCIIGVLERHKTETSRFYNAALVLQEKKILARARKQLFPYHAFFNEMRSSQTVPAEEETCVFRIGDFYCGLTISDDAWWGEGQLSSQPLQDIVIGSIVPDCLINISASAYYYGKLNRRQQVFSTLCRENHLPLVHVNQVGGQDSLVFDGHSMLIDKSGTVQAMAAGFAEDLLIVDTEKKGDTPNPCLLTDSMAQLEHALVLGIGDYLRKSGFGKALLGLSGGIDSALVAVLACRALGPENVLCVTMPSPYTSRQSVEEAEALAQELGCAFEVIPITSLMDSFQATLAPIFAGHPENLAEQNIQARIRGNLLMALSNKFGHMLLAAGNQSEAAMGYCTLYGDTCGGLAVIADLPKTMVYDLARHINREREVIPQGIITRPPSAELKPDQKDQDDLPPYDVLDAVLHAYFAERKTVEAIAEQGLAELPVVQDIIRRVMRNEHKRRQLPPGLMVCTSPLDAGRRYPLTQGFLP